jgi:glutamate 5-kinase
LLFQKAIAAVGQGRLMSLYDDLFGQFNQPIAQILLTKNDLADVSSYLGYFGTANMHHLLLTHLLARSL